MTISRLVNGGNLKAEEVDRLKLAFNRTLRSLHLVDRDDPIAELIAKKITEIDLTGVRDPAEISRIVVRQSPCPVREQRTSAFIDAPSSGALLWRFGLERSSIMRRLLIVCCAILTFAAFFPNDAFAQRGSPGGGGMGGGMGSGGMGGGGMGGGGMGGGGMGAGAFVGRGGGPIGGGGVAIGPHAVAPGGGAPFVAGPGYYGHGRHGAPIYVSPGGPVYHGRVAHGAPIYGRRGITAFRSGAHYPRHRHRIHGFAYYYGGWWYAYPWWESYYYDDCRYWHRRCAWRWGYGTWRYYRCIRYHGC